MVFRVRNGSSLSYGDKMKLTSILLCLAFLSIPGIAADTSASSEISISDLRVWKAEVDNAFGSFLLLSKADAKVMVSCKDGGGPLQSTIFLTYRDSQGVFQKHVFAGKDFYCRGAQDITRGVESGMAYELRLTLENISPSQRRVKKAVLSSSDGSKVFSTEAGSTNWLER